MSENLLQEYKEYYAVRAEKFADNPNYRNSYHAEKNLSDAMQSCSTLEEFKDKIGNKNELCAVAIVKDESIIEKAFFEKHKEDIRKLGPERIIEKADAFEKVMDLITMVNEETNKNSIEISMDESNRQMDSDWSLLDNIEIYENAEVPEKYKQGMQKNVQDFKKSVIRNVESLEKNNDAWQSNWKLQPDQILEYRHKRLMPYSDEHIKEQLAKYKSIINR